MNKPENNKPTIFLVGTTQEWVTQLNTQLPAYDCLNLFTQPESLPDVVEKEKPTIVVLHESFFKNEQEYKETILRLVTRFPHLRIIFLLKEENDEKRFFLFKWHVFNIILDKTIDDLIDTIHSPRSFQDIKVTFDKLYRDNM